MAYNPQNINGQATMANSSPVVIASDQSTLTITATALATGSAPHLFGGIVLIHKDSEYTTQQTTTALWTPASGKRFVVTDLTITTGGTTNGIVTLYDAAASTAYSAGTTPAVFRGEFAPSSTSRPGVVKSFNVPYVSPTVNNRLHVTTSAAMTVYIQVNGYEI
jgi:phosphoribosylpyrophosphate synthetase